LPVCTLPKLSPAGIGDSELGAMPEPDSGRFSVELEALLANAMLPLAAPAACGAKMTLKLVLQPAGRVTGRVSPLTLKPDP